ncbi:MAG: SUMF1/EgtB/PvdO family nonheme iron enzyme [Caldilineaceae bacterium]
MQLTGPQLHQIQEALLSAFPSKDELSMLARLDLEQNLDAIAGGENQRVIIFKLLTWAESNGRVAHLIAAALRQRPGNPLLQQLVQDSRGWGLPTQTTAPPTTRHSPPVTIDIFLSYSRQDAQIMQRIYADLRAAGFAVWIDEGLEPGTPHWQAAIEEAIRQARYMVVILTPSAKASPWVNNEIAYAQAHGRPVLPVLASGDFKDVAPLGLINVQHVDIRQDYGVVATSLLPALRAYLQPSLHDYLPRTLSSAPSQLPKPAVTVWKQPWLWGAFMALLLGIGVVSWPYLVGNFDFRSNNDSTATPANEVAANEPEPVIPIAARLPLTESITQTMALTATTMTTSSPTPLPSDTATATATPSPTVINTPTATSARPATSTAIPLTTMAARAISTSFSATATAQATVLQGSIRATLTALARTRAPTPLPSGDAVTLLGPLETTLKGRQTFRWTSNIILDAGQYYEMVFWPVGRDPMINGFSPVGASVENQVSTDLDMAGRSLSHLLIAGQEYEWGVLLVELNPYHKLQYLGGGHRFRFEYSSGGGGSAGGGQQSTGTPKTTATATLTPSPTSTPTLAPGATRVIQIAPGIEMTFVYVPAGEFSMGSPDGVGDDDEHPQHLVKLEAYWIGLTEVTNAQYRPFVEAGGYADDQWWTEAGRQWCQEKGYEKPELWNYSRWNDDLQPVVGISWYESYAYTQWLSAQTGLDIRLPTEAQWEKAVRGTNGRTYPWGEEEPTNELANYGIGGTKLVGSYPDGASLDYGALDMAGNVLEWTSSLYVEYPYGTDDGREEVSGAVRRVLRGGSWFNNPNLLRGANRRSYFPGNRDPNAGVRLVVLSPPE